MVSCIVVIADLWVFSIPSNVASTILVKKNEHEQMTILGTTNKKQNMGIRKRKTKEPMS